MARPKLDQGGLEKTIAFRLTRGDYEAYQSKFEVSGLTQSEFFRRHVLTNTTTVIARPRASADKQRLLYVTNKAGNNLNQLARRVHVDHAAGTLSVAGYVEILDALQQISRSLNSAVDHVD